VVCHESRTFGRQPASGARRAATARPWFYDLARWLRRWPAPVASGPARCRRRKTAPLAYHTPTFKGTHDGDAARPGDADVDEVFAARAMAGLGAWIMGRNMFGPIRGPWPDESWRGWGGQNPPYHTPVFVLTHHPRPPLEMEGGTVFHFVTDGIEAALERARAAAGAKDIRIGGGVGTIRQCLKARLIDEMHLAVAPILLGAGDHLLADIDLSALGYVCTKWVASAKAAHYTIAKS
jgi:dihydrofolate reductase